METHKGWVTVTARGVFSFHLLHVQALNMVQISVTVKNLPGLPTHSSMFPGEFRPGMCSG